MYFPGNGGNQSGDASENTGANDVVMLTILAFYSRSEGWLALSKRAGTAPAAAPKSHVVNCNLDAGIKKRLTGTAFFQDHKTTRTLHEQDGLQGRV